jgi:hypothetical protein
MKLEEIEVIGYTMMNSGLNWLENSFFFFNVLLLLYYIQSIQISLIVNITCEFSRLEDAGYAVGARVLELLCHRDKVCFLS